jgi:hypothetical protein
MVLGNRTIEKTELSFQSYREGSSAQMPEKLAVVADVIKKE